MSLIRSRIDHGDIYLNFNAACFSIAALRIKVVSVDDNSASAVCIAIRRSFPGFSLLAKESLVALFEWSELHNSSAYNFTRSQQIEMLVNLIELEGLDRVANPVLSRKRHDLHQVYIVAPI